MSPPARLNHMSSRVHLSRPALALSLVAILLISAPQLAGAGPPVAIKAASTLSVNSESVAEGDNGDFNVITFTLTLTGDSNSFSVGVFTSSLAGPNAATNDDYASGNANLHFAGTDGEKQTFSVTIVGDDTVEPDESFQLNVQAPNLLDPTLMLGLPTGCRCQAVGTILNDDVAISARAAPVVFARKGRDDLAPMARTIGGQPEVQVWNVNGETLLKNSRSNPRSSSRIRFQLGVIGATTSLLPLRRAVRHSLLHHPTDLISPPR